MLRPRKTLSLLMFMDQPQTARQRVVVCLAALGLLCAPAGLRAQIPDAPAPARPAVSQSRSLPEDLPAQPAIAPSLRIPAEPLGYAPPGSNAVGERAVLLSLEFLDENHLLFSFRVPGLLKRSEGELAGRQIRAVLLELTEGHVVAEGLWRADGRLRSIWPTGNGEFLLRTGNEIKRGNAALELKPFLRFDGPIDWVSLSPDGSHLAVDTEGQEEEKEHTLRIVEGTSGKVILESHNKAMIPLELLHDSFLEPLSGRGIGWILNRHYFTGPSHAMAALESECTPVYHPLDERLNLLSACTNKGAEQMLAVGVNGRLLWQLNGSESELWPEITRAASGQRFLRESLMLNRPVWRNPQVDPREIRGELVEVIDAADGRLVFSATTSPVLDGYGNAALSPSGRRVALLREGAVQIFELPAPQIIPTEALD